jgi:hypothetical protein
MKKIIIAVATLLTTVAHSQCDVKVTTDSYTQDRKVETGFIKFAGGTFKLHNINGAVVVYLSLNTTTYQIIDKDEIIYFKLEDGKIVKIANTLTSYGDYSAYTGFYNSFMFSITDEIILDAFKNSKIIGIKCYVNEYDINIGNRLKDNFNCITK